MTPDAAGLAVTTEPTRGAGAEGRVAGVAALALSAGGVAFFTVISLALWSKWTVPGGDIRDVFLAAGHAVRDGVSPYYLPGNPTPFFYSPPWAVFFAAVSFFPPTLVYCAVVASEWCALRYMAGSWMRVGYLLWIPLLPFELWGGAINLIVAAAIVAAVRGDAWLAVAGTLAKLSPILAADPREWLRYVLPFAVAFAITVPWLWLWPAWIDALLTALTGPPLGPLVPMPLWVRGPVALALILAGRPWARALGATIAIPAFYWVSLVVLIAPLCVWLWPAPRSRSWWERTREPDVTAPAAAPAG